MKLKKFLAGILAASVLVASLPVIGVSAAPAEEEPVLRVGIVGDAQCLPDTEPDEPRIDSNGWYTPAWYRGITAYEAALEQLKAKGVDLILDVGDIGNEGIPEVWEDYRETFLKVFPDEETRPEYLCVMGNHDYHVNLVYDTPEGKRADFNRIFEKESSNEHKVIDGYHFIGITCQNSGSDYSDETVAWLEQQLEEAAQDDPDKPIFVIGHAPVTDTVYGSDEYGKSTLDSVMKQYPQIVHFSGHSHCPLDDERSISQKDYTTINTASLNYTELESGRVGGTLPDGIFDCSQGLYMNIYSDRLDIERMDFTNHRTIKDNWVLDLPLTPETFTYTPKRAEERQAPVFPADANITCQPAAASCLFTFDQAEHEDFTHSYRIKIMEKETGKQVFEGLYFSDFYLGVDDMKPEISLSANGLQANTAYQASITAIESFGNESTPITADFTTADPTILDIDFTTGEIADNSRYQTEGHIVGNLPVEMDAELGKSVMRFDGESYLYLDMNQEQIDGITNSFTVESVFKVDELGETQDVFANTMGNGLSLEVSTDGQAGIWVRPKNIDTWVMVTAPIEADQYYHFVATYDGEYLTAYLNGKPIGSKEMTGEVWYSDPDVIKMTLGANPGEGGTSRGNGFDGSLAMVKIESTAATEAEAIGRYIDYIVEQTGENPDVVLDMDFENGIQDNSMYQTEYDVLGNYTISTDTQLEQKVLSLQGDNSMVRMQVNEYQLEKLKDSFTLETAFQLNELGRTQDVIANTEYGGISIEITADGRAQAWVFSEEYGDYIVPETTVEAGKYYHYAVVYDGENVMIYLNGEEAARSAMQGAVHFANAKDYPLCLGGDPQPNGNINAPLNGSIAFAHLEKTPLTAEQIKERYQTWAGIEPEGNKDALQALYDAYKHTANIGYTASSWAAFQAAIETAKTVLDNEAATSAEINEATAALQNAVDGLVNISTLEYVLGIANGHVEAGDVDKLVPSAQEIFNKVLASAQAIYDDPDATQEQVDTAWKTLMYAIQAMGFVPGDKTELIDLVAEAKALDLNGYEDGVEKDAFTAALKAAEDLIADPDAMELDIEAAYNALSDAMQNLIPKPTAGDKTELKKVIDEADGKNSELDRYVDDAEAKQKFADALAAAKEVYEKDGATQDEIDQAKNNLIDAMTGLRLRADKENLNKWLEDLKSIDLSQYTEESAAVVRAVIAKAEALAAQDLDENDQDLINAMVVEMAIAKVQLVLAPADPENPNPGDGSGESSNPNGDASSQSETNSEGKEATDEVPTTGDSAPVAAFSLLAVAVAGAWLAKKKRK